MHKARALTYTHKRTHTHRGGSGKWFSVTPEEEDMDKVDSELNASACPNVPVKASMVQELTRTHAHTYTSKYKLSGTD